MPGKHPNTEWHGGPGASHENAKAPPPEKGDPRPDGAPTNDRKSHVSGGGGERDLHHTHDPATKS